MNRANLLFSRVKEEWLAKNLLPDSKGITLKEIAAQYKIKYGTIRNRAAKENWGGELRERQAEMSKKVTDEVQSRCQLDMKERVERQLAGAKLLHKLVVLRANELAKDDAWKNIPISKIPEFLKIAAEEERKALGIADKLEVEVENKNEVILDFTNFSREDFATFRNLCRKAGLDPTKLKSGGD